MRLIICVLTAIFAVTATTYAQARRVPPRSVPSSTPVETSAPTTANSSSNQTAAAAMYEEAKDYSKQKFEEFKQKKLPYSDELREQTLREQKQLAARYALQLGEQNPIGENLYYLAMLHILASNDDAAADAFKGYLSGADLNADKAQTARSLLAVTAARRKDFSVAETALADYLKSSPVKTRERLAIERELAIQYHKAKIRDKAVGHAENAFSAARTALRDAATDERLLEVVAELGNTLFEIYSDMNQFDKANFALETLREVGINSQDHRLYLDASDKLITFAIENNRKPAALERAKAEQKAIDANFRDLTQRARVKNYFASRERHYKMLGETAPEFTTAQWITEKNQPGEQPFALSGLRGKVVVLDFWATWCKPCFDSFPELTEWHQTYGKQGLEVIGLTRFYGNAGGFNADEPAEFAYLQKFKREQRLPYRFVVAKDLSVARSFYAAELPTIVIIDKKGVIRFVEIGARANEELERLVQKLLAES